MKLSVIFEYDTETRVSTVSSRVPQPPFGLCDAVSVLHESHYADEAKKRMREACSAAVKGKIDSIMVPR